MKKLLYLTAFLLTGTLYAQHISTSGSQTNGDIYHLGGNLGIGTTTPNTKLDIIGTGNVGDIAIRSYALGGGGHTFEVGNSGLSILSKDVGIIKWGRTHSSPGYGRMIANSSGIYMATSTDNTSYTNRLFISQSGDVGIGTDSPGRKLDVNGNAKFEGDVRFNSPVTLFNSGLLWSPQGGAVDDNFGIKVTESGNNTTKLHIFRHFSYDAQDIDRMVIDASGKVGIGTTNPKGKLSLYNTTPFNSEMDLLGQDHILMEAIDPGNGGYFGGITWKSGNRRRASIVATREHNDTDYVGIAFFTRGTDGPGPMYESMRITRNGSVGIGTTTTGTHKLAVEGTIGAREVKVEAGTWSDFVFHKDYPLPTLAEVETHIKAKGHLKDIPSEAEVKANGIHLGEMDAKLLQKIEELTLYTIEQQKEIEELKKENETLKSFSKRLAALENQLKSNH